MTNKAILSPYIKMSNASTYWVYEEDAIKAMDEYAKQLAKEFAKWTAINLWSVHGDNWYPYMDEDNPISATELYELFIESQNK